MVVQYAIIWYLTRETGSATILSFATLLGMIPMVLLSPFVGPLVDRWDKSSLIVTDIIVAIFALILAVVGTISESFPIWLVLCLCLCVRSHKHSKCQRSSRLCRQSFHLLHNKDEWTVRNGPISEFHHCASSRCGFVFSRSCQLPYFIRCIGGSFGVGLLIL